MKILLISTIGWQYVFKKQKEYRTYCMRGAYQLMCFYSTIYMYIMYNENKHNRK